MHRHWLRHFPIGRHKNSVSRALLVLDQLLLLQVERRRNGSAPKLGDPLFLALTSRPQIARFRRSPGSNSLIKRSSQPCQWWIMSKSILWVRPKQTMSAFARRRGRADFLSHSSKSFSSLTEIRFSSLSGRRFALLGLLEVLSRPLPRNAGLVPFGQDYFYFSETSCEFTFYERRDLSIWYKFLPARSRTVKTLCDWNYSSTVCIPFSRAISCRTRRTSGSTKTPTSSS